MWLWICFSVGAVLKCRVFVYQQSQFVLFSLNFNPIAMSDTSTPKPSTNFHGFKNESVNYLCGTYYPIFFRKHELIFRLNLLLQKFPTLDTMSISYF